MTKLSKETQEAVKRVCERLLGAEIDSEVVSVGPMNKWIEVKFEDGFTWSVPRGFVSSQELREAFQRAADETAGRAGVARVPSQAATVTLDPKTSNTIVMPIQGPGGERYKRYTTEDVTSFDKDGPKAEPSGKPHGTLTTTYYLPSKERLRLDGDIISGDTLPGILRRLRGTMEAMSNVMACMRAAAETRVRCLAAYTDGQRYDTRRETPVLRGPSGMVIEPYRQDYLAAASTAWSAEVRAKVAAIKPPGPVISCQGDWEDD